MVFLLLVPLKIYFPLIVVSENSLNLFLLFLFFIVSFLYCFFSLCFFSSFESFPSFFFLLPFSSSSIQHYVLEGCPYGVSLIMSLWSVLDNVLEEDNWLTSIHITILTNRDPQPETPTIYPNPGSLLWFLVKCVYRYWEMGYKLSYGLYIGKWVFPSPETLTIYPQPGSLLYTLHPRPLLYTLNLVPYYIPFSRFLTIYPQRGSSLCSLHPRP